MKNVTDDSFESDVLKSEKPVLVDFWAEWCGPCRELAPVLDDLSSEMGNDLEFAKINIDDNPSTPGKYGVRGIPTLMLFHNGKIEATKVGAAQKSDIRAWVKDKIEKKS